MTCFVAPNYLFSTCGHTLFYKLIESFTTHDRSQTSHQFNFSHIQQWTKHAAFPLYFCPVNCIFPELASGKSLPRWNSRSYLGIKLSISPRHERSVYLVLNPVADIYPHKFFFLVNYFKTDRPSSNATTNVSNCKYFDSFRKVIRSSHTFSDTLIQYILGI